MIGPAPSITGPVKTATPRRPDPGVGPRVLCDAHAALAAMASTPSTVAWRMAESGRQLDANLLNLPAGHIIDRHTEGDLDVLVVVVAGSGTVTSGDTRLAVKPGELVWLPRGCTRGLEAGANGLAYLTVHQRRAGMHIRVGP